MRHIVSVPTGNGLPRLSTPELLSSGKTPRYPTRWSGVSKRSMSTTLATRAAAVASPMPGMVDPGVGRVGEIGEGGDQQVAEVQLGRPAVAHLGHVLADQRLGRLAAEGRHGPLRGLVHRPGLLAAEVGVGIGQDGHNFFGPVSSSSAVAARSVLIAAFSGGWGLSQPVRLACARSAVPEWIDRLARTEAMSL